MSGEEKSKGGSPLLQFLREKAATFPEKALQAAQKASEKALELDAQYGIIEKVASCCTSYS
jgi:hypothetical protein